MNLRKNYKLILFILALVLLVSISAPVDVAKAADGQTVLFDLQTADLAPLLTTGNSGSIPFMRKTGIAGTTYAS
ncbi:MAG: hypothetical protein FWG45_08050, partial [Oscillospiraceae bacterium]|nr:hypothetical protein [Oscillospiraceae bacterium]